jgi:hypothetical protein
MNASTLLWVGLTLIVAAPPLLGALKAGGASTICVIIGAVLMVIGCVLLVLGR